MLLLISAKKIITSILVHHLLQWQTMAQMIMLRIIILSYNSKTSECTLKSSNYNSLNILGINLPVLLKQHNLDKQEISIHCQCLRCSLGIINCSRNFRFNNKLNYVNICFRKAHIVLGRTCYNNNKMEKQMHTTFKMRLIKKESNIDSPQKKLFL